MKRVNTSQMVQFRLAYHYWSRGRRLTEAGHELTTFSSLDKSCEIDSKQGEGTSYIDEAIILDCDALELCPPGHPMRSASLICLAVHLGDRYNQLGAARDLRRPLSSTEKPSTFARKDTMIGQCH